MKTSWEIIRSKLTEGNRPGSFRMIIELNKAADLFVELLPMLKDAKAATAAMNADNEVRSALLMRARIDNMKKDGILPK